MRDAIVRVRQMHPPLTLAGVGGDVRVTAIVDVGLYLPIEGSTVPKYVELKNYLYVPEAKVELYPTRASHAQHGSVARSQCMRQSATIRIWRLYPVPCTGPHAGRGPGRPS